MTDIVSVNILTLPNDGGSAITDLEYRVNAGAAVSLGETTTGSYPIVADVADDIQIRAVNAIGAGAWSDVKAVPSAGFDPATLFASGEAGAWYEPSPTTCFTDTAGTIPAAVGDAVARINDLSGNGNHATQGTAAARPTLQQTAGGLYYLDFDGVDDSMVTPTITPGTDKVQVFAGVRKLANSTVSCVFESSLTSNVNNGTVAIFDTTFGNENNATWRSRGTLDILVTSSADEMTPPVSRIITGLSDISSDTATMRIDGTQAAQSTSDQGTGNYLAYPMYIGSRAGTSLFFNGQIYSLVTRFGPNLDAPVIGKTETYVAKKTGVDLT